MLHLLGELKTLWGIGVALLGSTGLIVLLVVVFLGGNLRVAGIAVLVSGLMLSGTFATGFLKGRAQCEHAVELAAAQARVAQLEQEKAALAAIVAKQNEIEDRNQKEMADSAETIANLERIIQMRPSDHNCPRAATADELRGIKALK